MKLQNSRQALDERRRMFNFTLQLFLLSCEDQFVARIHFLVGRRTVMGVVAHRATGS